MKNVIYLFVCMVLIISFSASAFGAASLSYDTYSYHAGIDAEDHKLLSAPDKVSGGNFITLPGPVILPNGYGFASGYADATQLKTGIKTSAGSLSPGWAGSSFAESKIENTFTVTATDSGMEGDLVRLSLSFRLDGKINVTRGANAEGRAELGIYDLTRRTTWEGGEFEQPELVYLSAEWIVKGNGGADNWMTVAWQANHNLGFTQNGHENVDYYANESTDSDAPCYYDWAPYPGGDFTYDTSLLTFNFLAEVGHTYTIYENISNLSEAEENSSSLVDFSNTFFGNVISLEEDVRLDWEFSNGAAPVPVPSTMALLISGLIGLAGVGRKQK